MLINKSIEIRNTRCELVSGEDVSFFEGRLKTFIETLGLKENQEKSAKDICQTILWDWFNYITSKRTDHLTEKKDWYSENKTLSTKVGSGSCEG